ncbi:hypothetical protein AcV7_003748 [Taiwanofungus camphoratus]|nr:hypothetical protein AcV7_003748 [Antrodia cinnamomea]
MAAEGTNRCSAERGGTGRPHEQLGLAVCAETESAAEGGEQAHRPTGPASAPARCGQLQLLPDAPDRLLALLPPSTPCRFHSVLPLLFQGSPLSTMSFILTRPPSPSLDIPQRDHRHDEDSLSAALHAALQPFSSSSSHPTGHPHNHATNSALPHDPPTADMHKDKQEKFPPTLDIVVNSDTLCLRGTGIDVNAALLSGNVVLHLAEPTSIKEIVLQFRGKARLPVSSSEPLSLSSSQLTYLVCNHEWSFLEGNRAHAHTLKAGRHLFPFQLQIGGSLPSSIATTALGGASVQYKLRATAVRPGFGLGIAHRDLQATLPISILRGFTAEALEYQQTLEIENTWPEKLMYSIMLPHKAWAAGAPLAAVVKFAPLAKGARVRSVATTLNETVKLYARQGTQESTRVIASTRHDIVDGRALCVDEQTHRYRIPLLHHHAHTHTSAARLPTSSSPASPAAGHAHHNSVPSLNGAGAGSYFPALGSHPPSPLHAGAELAPLTTTTSNSSASSGPAPAPGSGAAPSPSPAAGDEHVMAHTTHPVPAPLPPMDPSEAELIEPAVDIVTTLGIMVPMHATPSHSLEPIQVSHRIRWSILIGNSDGHTSELRCSLPLHVLDARLADEARVATLATRRLLLGAADIDGGTAQLGTDSAEGQGAEDDMDLPSYPAHVRDRVANAYLPEAAVMRVVNPWVMQGVSPTLGAGGGGGGVHSESSSGVQSPAAFETWAIPGAGSYSAPAGAHGNAHPHANRHHLPHEPAPGAQPLEWVNTELLLSLGQEAPEAPPPAVSVPRTTPPSRTPPEGGSAAASRHGSRFPSRRSSRAGSRAGSRASSPERGAHAQAHAHAHAHGAPAPAGETYVHNGSTASRNMHGLFNIAMRPFTSLGSTFGLASRSASHTNLHGHALSHGPTNTHSPSQAPSAAASTVNLLAGGAGGGPGTPAEPQPAPLTSPQLLHRAFTEVPDYDMASRGFLGGGITPLTSLRGLPSYEEAERTGGGGAQRAGGAERSLSDTDLVGMFAGAQRQQQQQQLARAQGARTAASTPPPPPARGL